MHHAEKNDNIYERPNHFVSLNTFREQDELCDVIIRVGNKEIRAHRLILAATINYFKTMFLGDFEERQKYVISIKDISAENMEAIITFAYTGIIAFTKENAMSLLKIADYFELTDVKDECVKFLESNLITENVCEVLYLARLLPGCSSLLERSKTFIRHNLQDVSLTDEYKHLEFEFLESILSETENLNISSETIFEVIMRWITEEVDSKMTHLSELLCHVTLSDLTAEFLIHSLFKDEFRDSLGPKHSELVTKVLSVFNELKIKNVPKNSKTYIHVEDYHCRTEIYDFTTEEWTLTKIIDAIPSSCSGIFARKDKLYRLTGRNGYHVIMSVYSFEDKYWTFDREITAPFKIYSARSIMAYASEDRLYMCGEAREGGLIKDDFWIFFTDACKWQHVALMTQSQFFSKIVVLQRFIYTIGSQRSVPLYGLQKAVLTMERYNPVTNNWTFVSNFDVQARLSYELFGAVGLNDKIYLCGGLIDGTASTLLQSYDLKTNKWTELASMSSARYSHLVVEHNGKIWAIGGHGMNKNSLSSVEVYDPVSNSWTNGKPMKISSGAVTGCIFSNSN